MLDDKRYHKGEYSLEEVIPETRMALVSKEYIIDGSITHFPLCEDLYLVPMVELKNTVISYYNKSDTRERQTLCAETLENTFASGISYKWNEMKLVNAVTFILDIFLGERKWIRS